MNNVRIFFPFLSSPTIPQSNPKKNSTRKETLKRCQSLCRRQSIHASVEKKLSPPKHPSEGYFTSSCSPNTFYARTNHHLPSALDKWSRKWIYRPCIGSCWYISAISDRLGMGWVSSIDRKKMMVEAEGKKYHTTTPERLVVVGGSVSVSSTGLVSSALSRYQKELSQRLRRVTHIMTLLTGRQDCRLA
jgi:hypothetical protein